ncbi:MAG: hypothetical protein WCD80_11515 [Desulfobaccales bacterium]
MGLWLKCPGCQAKNPLSVKVCPTCGQDVDKLAAKQRVYVIGPADVSAPVQAAPKAPSRAAAATQRTAPSPAAAPTSQAAKQPKRTKKKKG